MSPRPATLVATVLDSIQRVPAILTDQHTALWAGVLAALSWAIGAANLRLLAVVIAAMLLDLALGSLWAVIDPATHFNTTRLYGGILGKVVRLLAIPAASCADWLFLASPFAGHIDTAHYAYPISAYVMWALAIAELVSALRTLIAAGVAPAALAALIARLQAKQPALEVEAPSGPHLEPPEPPKAA